MMDILSVHNPRVKLWSQLLEKKGRDKNARFLIEGVRLVQEALLSGAPIETIVYSKEKGIPHELTIDEHKNIEQIAVSEAVLAKCSDTLNPQGVFAVIHKFSTSVESIIHSDRSLVVVADGVQDPGNLGTIIRSADAVGATGVLIGKGTVDLYNPKTIRATMGSLFHLPVLEGDLLEFLPLARSQGAQIISTSLQAEKTCFEMDLSGPKTWIILGNEGQGVSKAVEQYVDAYVKIPMPGRAESLNVAMAAIVLLYESLRQRDFTSSYRT